MIDTKLSLVVPAYNEAAIIADTIRSLLVYLDRHFADYELIISDDGSTDDTKAIVGGFENSHLRVVGSFPNAGKGAAVRRGMLAASGAIIAYTDADLAYGTEVIAPMVRQLLSEADDIVIGSRRLHPDGFADYPPLRLLASRTFSFITGTFAGFHYDTQCGLKAFSASAAQKIFSVCETAGFAFDFEVLMLAAGMNMKIGQIPVKIINHRNSKVNVLRDSVRMFGDVATIRSSVKKRLG